MLFAHDTSVSLDTAAALANTQPGEGDGASEALPDLGALEEFTRTWEFTGSRARDAEELAQVRALRPVLRAVWAAAQAGDEDAVVEAVNGWLRGGCALPQLVRHAGWEDYHLHATTPEQGLATRMAVEFAMALVDVVRAGELSRLRTCEGQGCDALFVDASRNRSRRFCSTRCGNLANVRAYRERQG